MNSFDRLRLIRVTIAELRYLQRKNKLMNTPDIATFVDAHKDAPDNTWVLMEVATRNITLEN